MQLYGIIIKRTHYFPPFPYWQHLTKKEAACCQSLPTPVLSSRDSVYCSGMSLLGHPHPERENISHLIVSLHWFSDIAMKNNRGILSLLYLWPSKAWQKIFFHPWLFRTGKWSHRDFLHFDILPSPSIFQYKTWIATVVGGKKIDLIS